MISHLKESVAETVRKLGDALVPVVVDVLDRLHVHRFARVVDEWSERLPLGRDDCDEPDADAELRDSVRRIAHDVWEDPAEAEYMTGRIVRILSDNP